MPINLVVKRIVIFTLVLMVCLPTSWLLAWFVEGQTEVFSGYTLDHDQLRWWTCGISVAIAAAVAWQRGRPKKKQKPCAVLNCLSVRFRA